ncbi:MAG: exopolyphosphatase [Cyclobacteriaceae bacterium]|nr:MAG: exopolyphosphatase [Cyclobacteriaceae bacterium]
MKLAAVDIGSNAIRFQVSSVLDSGPRVIFKKMEYVRFPLRLGHDVFTTQRISEHSAQKFIKLMRVFKMLIELYEADDYMACATSAMRESENGAELAQRVKEETGLDIHIIDGKQEAELINQAILTYLSEGTYLHIDVGGGSTELNIYVNGKKTNTRSFKIGSVRILERSDSPAIWKEMEQWVKKQVQHHPGKITAIGTGGNISKIFELAQLKPHRLMSLKKVREISAMIEQHTLEERIYLLQMNPDRADVILPASQIYIKVMEWAGARYIQVPEVGLKDGIMLHLYRKNKSRKKVTFANLADQSQGKKTIKL